VRISHIRNFKTRFVKLGPQLQMMPREADVLSQNKLSIVANVLPRRSRMFGLTPKIWALATREAKIPSFVRPESEPAAKSRIFKASLRDIPGFGTRREGCILHFDGIIKSTQSAGNRNPAGVVRSPDHWIECILSHEVRCIDEIQRRVRGVLVLNRSHIFINQRRANEWIVPW